MAQNLLVDCRCLRLPLLGTICLLAGPAGLMEIQLRGGLSRARKRAHRLGLEAVENPAWSRAAIRQLAQYARGERRHFRLRLAPPPLSSFSRLVLEQLARVPYGQVIGYGELARRCGRPGAARAVGAVMAANPLPIIWPCHRVVAARGLGGYGGGLALKRALLRHEGVALPAPA